MLPILLAAAIWLPALTGLGSPLAIALRRSSGAIVSSVAVRAAIAGLLGMFVASTFAAAANLFVPVYPWVSTALLLVGWFLVLRQRRRWRRLPRSSWQLCCAIILVIALIDARGLPWYDTGLYHLQAVAWMTTGPLPQGLANLFDRLGFNCSWFCFAAAVETPLALGKSCFIVNALLAILIALPAVDAMLRTARSTIRPDRVLLVLMLIPLGIFGVDQGMISSLAPDLIVMLLVLFSISFWLRSPRFTPHILTFACFALTIKLSAAPLLLIAIVFHIAGNRRWGILPTTFCILAGLISLTRGIWLSGYPAFPSTIGRMSNLSWTAPPGVPEHAAWWIEHWAKYDPKLQPIEPGSPWMAAWMLRVGLSQPMLIAYGFFITGVVLCGRRDLRRIGLKINSRFAIAAILLLPALAFWFITAPQPRFGFGYIFSIPALPVAIGLSGCTIPAITKRLRQAAVAAAILILLLFFRIDRHILKASLLRWPAIPTANLVARHTTDGTTIWKPLNNDRAWNAPLPATPELNPQLRCDIDTAGRIRRFRVDPPN